MGGSISAPYEGRSGPRVAYQGEPGAFGEIAVTRHWSGAATPCPTPTFADAFALLNAGLADYAVIPVWNSTIGELHETRAMLGDHDTTVGVVADITLSVQHCLLGLPGGTLERVRFVGSHPAALAQCAGLFVTHPQLLPRAAYDTAGAARELVALAGGACVRDPGDAPPWYEACGAARAEELAVIASAEAARRYGLVTLAESVQDEPDNVTRFAVVSARRAARW